MLVNHGERRTRYQSTVTLDHVDAIAVEVAVDVVLPAMTAQTMPVGDGGLNGHGHSSE